MKYLMMISPALYDATENAATLADVGNLVPIEWFGASWYKIPHVTPDEVATIFPGMYQPRSQGVNEALPDYIAAMIPEVLAQFQAMRDGTVPCIVMEFAQFRLLDSEARKLHPEMFPSENL